MNSAMMNENCGRKTSKLQSPNPVGPATVRRKVHADLCLLKSPGFSINPCIEHYSPDRFIMTIKREIELDDSPPPEHNPKRKCLDPVTIPPSLVEDKAKVTTEKYNS